MADGTEKIRNTFLTFRKIEEIGIMTYDLTFQGITLQVNDTGSIKGLKGEGTNSIVLFVSDASLVGAREAIRIPRLLKFDELLNFHLAEISRNEAIISKTVGHDIGTWGATRILDLSTYDPLLKIPVTEENDCFLGFYFSPQERYKIIVVSKQKIWPSYSGLSDINPIELHKFLNENLKLNGKNDVYFIPDPSAGINDNQGGLPFNFIKLNRSLLDTVYKSRNTAGWWFNLPVTVHQWMIADLERILTDLKQTNLIQWKLDDWFDLAETLAQGLKNIHNKNCIHGDIRPANIMTSSENDFAANTFGWIDIGLGNINRNSQVPAPLGGGRDSPFYAPERRENLEFEDADVVNLEKDAENKINLKFKWWKRRIPGKEAEILSLESRELGKLKCNDRIQIREFVLVVEAVDVTQNCISISEIYEVISENVLISRTGQDEIIALLSNAPISRYRLHKGWSQATDIYGFGCIVLYLFFMRGLCLYNNQNLSFEKDRMFISIINMLGSSTFLKTFWDIVSAFRPDKGKGKFEFEELLDNDYFQPPYSSELAKKYSDIAEYLESIDSGFTVLLRGFNNHVTPCVVTLLFCLRCIWRMEDIENIKHEDNLLNLNCYSEKRDFYSENGGKAAAGVFKDIKDIHNAINRSNKWIEDVNHNYNIAAQASELQKLGGAADKGRAVALIKKLNDIRKEKDEEINQLKMQKDAKINQLNMEIAILTEKNTRAQKIIANRGSVYYAPSLIKEIEQALK